MGKDDAALRYRFVILKQEKEGSDVFLEYDENILKDRIQARIAEWCHANGEKRKIQTAQRAFVNAFNVILNEFKCFPNQP